MSTANATRVCNTCAGRGHHPVLIGEAPVTLKLRGTANDVRHVEAGKPFSAEPYDPGDVNRALGRGELRRVQEHEEL